MNVLLVEDNESLSSALKQFFRQNHIHMDVEGDGVNGLEAAMSEGLDVVILDVRLPGMDGFTILQELRKAGIETPVLMLTAVSTVSDRIRGLNMGADDYLPKPFDSYELLARVNALAKRKVRGTLTQLSYEDISMIPGTPELAAHGRTISLSHNEYEVMLLLVEAQGECVNKEKIAGKIAGVHSDTSYNNAEVYISFLRKKLKALHSNVEIRAARGMGYKLAAAE